MPRSYGADNLRFLAGVRSLAYVTASRTHFMLRERTPVEVVLYAIYLYLSGLSLRQTARTLTSIGVKRSRKQLENRYINSAN